MILVFKSTQIRGLQQSVRERLGRRSLGGEVSYSSERRKMMERVEELSVLLSGGSALGAELELFGGEDSNDLSRIVSVLSSPLYRIQPPLIYRGRSGTWRFRKSNLWSTCARVQEVVTMV
jgi:hypothetical protein